MCESTIKKGALVKAWDEDSGIYVIGIYDKFDPRRDWPNEVNVFGIYSFSFKNAIEIPEELAKQLEELGK